MTTSPSNHQSTSTCTSNASSIHPHLNRSTSKPNLVNTSSYTTRLASWSQPKPTSNTQSGFRIGRGTFWPNQSKLITEALIESDHFINRLISINSTLSTTNYPHLQLTKPLVIPQSLTGTPTAYFLRSTTDELNCQPNGIPIDLFTEFLDLLNSLLLAGVGSGCAAADIQSDHHQLHQPTTTTPDYPFPPPDYLINQPKLIDRFLLSCNQHLFKPRQIECRILTNEQMRTRLSLPDPISQMTPDQILTLAHQTNIPQSINSLPNQIQKITLPIKITPLTHFPTKVKILSQIYKPRPIPRRPIPLNLHNNNNNNSNNTNTNTDGWENWKSEMENLARSNLSITESAYWILIDKIR
ncbi:hypothetical protein CROQUDRAFT_45106 [Cronartium quercuum f. sp. fusiforme G11]|uniref:Uncharacterized protein n=1 Tax=Cronartium quercuum f. sp. fusiforme G11 TaxID=708437 RepID=A0A9P6NHB9_9BASI|nr:hypothetical protein CROQUDRAFT_45106 [Cronartium quercuum f. sp. fusiforme G11]